MKRNWAAFFFRVAVGMFIIVATIYEVVENGFPFWELFADNTGLNFAIKFVAIPFSIMALLVWGYQWVVRGLDEPKLNWEEGSLRVACLVCAILVATVFIWSLIETRDLLGSLIATIISAFIVLIVVSVGYWIIRDFTDE